MKKLVFTLTFGLSLLALSSQAQKKADNGVLSFGIRAGVNFQNINGKDANGDKLDYKLKTGFNVGANVELPLADEFYLQPGLLFSTKGHKSKTVDGSRSISYLELPINFLYKPVLGEGKLLLGVGPYIAYGIGGKVKFTGNGTTINRDVKFKNSVNQIDYYTSAGAYFKPFDFGANLLAGYELSNNLSVQLNAQLGLAKINPKLEGSTSNAKETNTGFGVSVGYRFK